MDRRIFLKSPTLRSGIVHLDSTHVNQGWQNEVILGILLKEFERDSFIISTKVKGDGMELETGKFTTATSPEEFLMKF